MVFCKDLDSIVIRDSSKAFDFDEFIVISGYVGPNPIKQISSKGYKSTVIYGMYGAEKITKSLHEVLLKETITSENMEIKYSTVPIHSKCYVWLKKKSIIYSLVGSANFSSAGLYSSGRELLSEVSTDSYSAIKSYIDYTLDNSIACNDVIMSEEDEKKEEKKTSVCSLPLYTNSKTGTFIVPLKSGLNWGMAKKEGCHVNTNDAYIPIRKQYILDYSYLFPPKMDSPVKDKSSAKKEHRHNDCIDVIWDDGTSMRCLMEGTMEISDMNGNKIPYPKQIASSPKKDVMGKYLRKRLGVKEGSYITYNDLVKYGRTSVDISKLNEDVYYFDFSPER